MSSTVHQIALMYELSLTTGRYESPDEIGRQFLKKLLSRKGINYGAIWVLDSIEDQERTFKRLYALPSIEGKVTLSEKSFRQLFQSPGIVETEGSIFPEIQIDGPFSYIKLRDYGILELHSASLPKNISKTSLGPLVEIFDQLAVSLRAAESYQLLKQEIYERKKAEQLLISNEKKYRGIIDNIHLGLLEVDLNEQIQYANEAFCEIVGYTLEELLGRKASEVLIPEEDEEERERVLDQNRSRKEGKYSVYEAKVRKKDGSQVWMVISGAPNYDDKGELIGSIGIHLDISQQKELSRMQSQFISMTSHELRTPLTAITSNIELLNFHIDKEGHPDKDRLRKSLKRMEENSLRLNNMVANILLINQLDNKKIPFDPEQVDLTRLIRDKVIPTMMDSHKGRRINFSEKGIARAVNIDPKLFIHILTNLVENAFKYSPAESPADVDLVYEEDQVSIAVSDRGIGIPQDQLNNLFENFYRATNVGNVQGSGIGLAIVKEFVDLHKGEIKVKSLLNKGTTFTILLRQ